MPHSSSRPPMPPKSSRPVCSSPNPSIYSPLLVTPLSENLEPSCTTPLLSTNVQCTSYSNPPSQQTPSTPSFLTSLSTYFSSRDLRPKLGLRPPVPPELDLVSLLVVYWIILVSEASRGLMLPSTWPYFNSLGGTKATLGVFVASFSIGRMSTTIPLGYLSDNFATSSVLIIASLVQVLGHLIYALSPNLSFLYASRIIVGLGSATMSVCRAHVTRSVPSSCRTHHFAYLSALQFIGFAVLPGVGGLMAMIPELNFFNGLLKLNGFTYPAFVLVASNFVSVFLIYSFYLDPPSNGTRRRRSETDNAEPSASPDFWAMVVCLLVNVVFRGVVAEFETVSTPFLMEQYGLSYGEASIRISIIGFFGLFVYLGFKPISRAFVDRILVMFGLMITVIGCMPLSIPAVAQHLPAIAYVASLGLTWSVAYPIGQTAVLSLFSKVLAGLPAGGFLGIFSATGSIARVIFAMVAGYIWSEVGREAVFASIVGYVLLVAGVVVLGFKRLVPAEGIF